MYIDNRFEREREREEEGERDLIVLHCIFPSSTNDNAEIYN